MEEKRKNLQYYNLDIDVNSLKFTSSDSGKGVYEPKPMKPKINEIEIVRESLEKTNRSGRDKSGRRDSGCGLF